MDPGSVFEIGGRGAEPATRGERGHRTRDGALTAFGKVAGTEVVVIADDAAVLARTDGEVARLKRHRTR